MSVINGGVSVLNSLWTGATGLNAFSSTLEVVSDNIANLNTYGFKSRRPIFAEIFADVQAITNRLGQSQAGEGVRLSSIRTNFAQGQLETSTNPWDLAIDGDAFFVLEEAGRPDLPLYSRVGAFEVGKDETGRDGIIVNAEGLKLQVNQGGAIGSLDISADDLKRRFGDDFVLAGVSVAGDGTITAEAVTGRVETLGTLHLVKFHNPEALLPMGGGVFTESHDSGLPLFFGSDIPFSGVVYDHSLELSNVDLSTQFTDLIEFQRAFQINNKVVSLSDDILQTLVRMKR
jgi:flagellar hook protein FlgE